MMKGELFLILSILSSGDSFSGYHNFRLPQLFPVVHPVTYQADSLNLRVIGKWPFGIAWAVTVTTINDTIYAFVGSFGGGIYLLNVQDPTNPQKVSEIATPGFVKELFFVWPYLYVADGVGGLRIIDYSEPTYPQEIGSYYTSGEAHGIFVKENYAYLTCWDKGLWILDISDPEDPDTIATYQTYYNAYKVQIAGDYVYVIEDSFDTNINLWGYNSALEIINISEPTNPIKISSRIFKTWSTALFIADTLLFITDYTDGGSWIEVYNIVDPLNIVGITIGGQYLGYFYVDLFVAEEYIYVTDLQGIGVFKFTQSRWEEIVYNYNFEDDLFHHDLFVMDNYLYTAAEGAFVIINISYPHEMQQVSEYLTPVARKIFVFDQYAYLIASNTANIFQIIDISYPTTPFGVGTYKGSEDIQQVWVKDNHVYIANGERGLRIIDISDPSSPLEVGAYDPGDFYVKQVQVIDNYALVASKEQGAVILDISSPETPVIETTYRTYDEILAFTIKDNYAYVAAGDAGLRILDITDLTNLQEVNAYDTTGYVEDVFICQDYAFLIDNNSHNIKIINIANPFSLSFVGEYTSDKMWEHVFISNFYAFFAQGLDGLKVIDFSNPTLPTEFGFYDTPGYYVRYVWVINDTIYLTNATGFLILGKSATGIEEYIYNRERAHKKLLVFPNPLKECGQIFYTLNHPSEVTISLYDISGRLVKVLEKNKKNAGIWQIPLLTTNLQSGIYFLRLQSDEIKAIQKILVIK